jgi:hypothetical protein
MSYKPSLMLTFYLVHAQNSNRFPYRSQFDFTEQALL